MGFIYKKFIVLFFAALVIQYVFVSGLAAVPEQYKVIKDIEKAEGNKGTSSNIEVRAPIAYKADSFRDPFQGFIMQKEEVLPPAQARTEEVSGPPALTVQGIIWGGNFPQAIINNKVVRVGDTVGEAKILEINKSGITVFYKNKNYTFSSPAGRK